MNIIKVLIAYDLYTGALKLHLAVRHEYILCACEYLFHFIYLAMTCYAIVAKKTCFPVWFVLERQNVIHEKLRRSSVKRGAIMDSFLSINKERVI